MADLQVPPGTLQVTPIYLPLSRVNTAKDVTIFRPFNVKVLQIRPSLAQDAEMKRLDKLNRKTQRECAFFAFKIV